MFAFTRTPLGRMLNAVRDNPERVEFIGYNTQRVRYLAFIIVGLLRRHRRRPGGAELRDRHGRGRCGAARSGAYLLFTFLGGATFFFGPIIGAVLMVLALVLLSELTKAWLLYLGLVFLFMVMYAPGGIASLIMMNLRVAAFGKLRQPVDGLPGAGRHAAGGAGRRRRDDRDGLPPAAQRRARARAALSWRGARTPRASTAGSARPSCCWSAWSLFELARREFAARVGHESRKRSRTKSSAEREAAVVEQSECALELRDVRKSFGKTEIIRGANLAVKAGERVAIIGPNGAGKSTLFNLISGRFGLTSGEILLHGERIDGLEPFEINRLGLARSFQVSNLFTRLSVFENIRCAVLWCLGYRYAFWKFLADLRRRQRPRRRGDGDDQARQASATCWR